MQIKIAAAVILYNPPSEVYNNILSFYNSVERVYILDNSTYIKNDILSKLLSLKKVVYKKFEKNIGIASALNISAKLGIGEGYNYLMTFDQDSYYEEGKCNEFLSKINNLDFSYIGIISPFHNINNFRLPKSGSQVIEVDYVPTSGNILNLNAFKMLGPFNEKLFIDYVDVEYCLRLRKAGYKVLMDNTIMLNHQLGDLHEKNILFLKKIGITHHNPIRIYYRTRNRLFVVREYFLNYPEESLLFLRMILTDIFKILFFEKEKIKKIGMMFLGAWHFTSGKYGKYDQ
jgi:rhamnosyltransferase